MLPIKALRRVDHEVREKPSLNVLNIASRYRSHLLRLPSPPLGLLQAGTHLFVQQQQYYFYYQ